MRPLPASNNGPIELKLGIKSSFPDVKQAIGLLIAIWKATDEDNNCEYSISETETSIVVHEDIFQDLLAYFGELIQNENDFRIKVNENRLFESQIEPLIVGFELVWRLAKIEFVDPELNYASERTGGLRHPKKISYTSNLDLINLVIKSNVSAKEVLYCWIIGEEVPDEENFKFIESKLIKCLTILSELAIYRLRVDASEEIEFMNLGIYDRFLDGTEKVNITDNHEEVGSLRVLRSLISEGLNLYLGSDDDNMVVFDTETNALENFKNYRERVRNYHSLMNIIIDESCFIAEETARYIANGNGEASVTELAHNRIFFGAPGTGKSYILEQERQRYFRDDNFERVTFHPEYTYGQFVGSYKPRPKNVDGNAGEDEEFITYEYVPGPFLRLLVRAINNPEERYLLIIEEINRANAAGVFGDTFQLLDRWQDGESEYGITTSEDMREYLESQGVNREYIEELKLPRNLYLWATMNSADQGVYPLDAAFKRRWHFRFVGIDEGKEAVAGREINLNPYGIVRWDEIRRLINDKLTQDGLRINEDKLLGPFFLNDYDLSLDDIDDVFKSKVILYLYEDVLKNRQVGFFRPELNTISKIYNAYDAGENVFGFNVHEYLEIIDAHDEGESSPAQAEPGEEPVREQNDSPERG